MKISHHPSWQISLNSASASFLSSWKGDIFRDFDLTYTVCSQNILTILILFLCFSVLSLWSWLGCLFFPLVLSVTHSSFFFSPSSFTASLSLSLSVCFCHSLAMWFQTELEVFKGSAVPWQQLSCNQVGSSLLSHFCSVRSEGAILAEYIYILKDEDSHMYRTCITAQYWSEMILTEPELIVGIIRNNQKPRCWYWYEQPLKNCWGCWLFGLCMNLLDLYLFDIAFSVVAIISSFIYMFSLPQDVCNNVK